MFRSVPIDEYVSEGTRRDAQWCVADRQAKGGKVRLIFVPAHDLNDACAKIGSHIPFKPTLCGVPVAFGVREHIEVISVHDDNTNVARAPHAELEVA